MEAGDERRFRRRRFVLGAASGAAALALPAWLRPTGGPQLDTAVAAPVEPYSCKLPIPRELTGLEPDDPHRAGRGEDPPRPEDEDVDVRRDLPGTDDPPPFGRAHDRHVQAPAAQESRRAHRPPPRRAHPLEGRRAAGRPHQIAAALVFLRHLPRAFRARVGQRPADRARATSARTATTSPRTAPTSAPRCTGTTTIASTAPARTSGAASPACGSPRTRPTSRSRCLAATATCR